MPVVNVAATKREVENAVQRRFARSGLTRTVMQAWAREGAPERARPDTWAAVSALTWRQRAVVDLSFWYGLSQGVESRRLNGFA